MARYMAHKAYILIGPIKKRREGKCLRAVMVF